MVIKVTDLKTLQTALETLCEFLSSRNLPSDCVFDSKLVACELLGNVLRHSTGNAELHGAVGEEFVELKIKAERIFQPPKESQCSDVFAESGRGLYLVDSVCAERTWTENGEIFVKIKIKKA